MGVSWKRFVKIKLEAFLPFYKPKQEARHPVSLSRKCKTKNWLCTACNVPSATSVSVKLGFGGNCGWQSSLTSNVPSLPNTRQNTKRKLPLLKPTLVRHWKTEKR